jgi:hypothetical protein
MKGRDMDHDEDVSALLAGWVAAEAGNDPEALETLLADDFTAVGPHGFVLDRGQWLERYRSHALRNTAFTLQEPRFRAYGHCDVVIARQIQQATYQGSDASGQFRATLVAVPVGDQLRIAGVHLSPINGPVS